MGEEAAKTDAVKKAATPIRTQMLAWQKSLNYVSGSIVLAYGGKGLKVSTLEEWKLKLRGVLQQMGGLTPGS